jgi:hypothetical protein
MAFSTSLGEATVKIRATWDSLDRDLGNASRKITETLGKAGRAFNEFGSKLSGFVSLPLLGLFSGLAKDFPEVRDGLREVSFAFDFLAQKFRQAGLGDLIANFLYFVSQMLVAIGNLNPSILRLIGTIAAIGIVAGPALKVLGFGMEALAVAGRSLIFLVGVIRGIGVALLFLTRCVPILAAISTAAMIVYEVWTNWDAIIAKLTAAWNVLVSGLSDAAALLSAGKFAEAWQAASQAVIDSVKMVYDGVKKWLVDEFGGIIDSIEKACDKVKGFFTDMWDYLVGHSVVPDTIDGIETQFNRLDTVMVDKSEQATDATKKNFKDLQDSSESTFSNIVKANDAMWAKMSANQRSSQFVGSRIKDTFFSNLNLNYKDIGGSFQSGLSKNIDNYLNKQLNDSVDKIFTKMFSSLDSAGGSGGGGIMDSIGGGLNKMFGSVFSGLGFADGGRPPVGKASIVGENGPELFVPDGSGTIVPNSGLGGGSGTNVNVTQHFNVSTGVVPTVRAEISRMMPKIRAETVNAVVQTSQRGGSASAALRGTR